MTNVKDFGAVGDGKADDSGAIQHAFEQVGGSLTLPKGTYRLTRPIEIALGEHGPASISGLGGVARLRMDGPGPALRVVGTHDKSADPQSFRPEVWERERLPTVSGIEILGNHDQADGIELEGTMQGTISGVLIRRCRYGVHLVKRNRNVLLANSHIYHGLPGGIGVYFDGVNL
ncbi:MAG: glycosyl hydrolase family 28-related protein, partial [Isosphaeraceae bacterium]